MLIAIYYLLFSEETLDPRPTFFNKEVQSLLRDLTRVDLKKVFRKKKLGEKLRNPEYKFMTDAELEAAVQRAWNMADRLLQIPPVVPVRKPVTKIFSEDPALQGLDSHKYVFTDITYGIKNTDRLIVIRDPDGTLRDADWDTKERMNKIYFPKKRTTIEPPLMFQDNYLESLLNRREYVFILDRACLQFEPNDPEYQKIVSITYQHINDNDGFDLLRSTRHFGALAFFLVWNKTIDNLMLELIETVQIEEVHKLLELYAKVNKVNFEGDEKLKVIEDYIQNHSKKKGSLELALQTFKDLVKQKEALEQGLKTAHGLAL